MTSRHRENGVEAIRWKIHRTGIHNEKSIAIDLTCCGDVIRVDVYADVVLGCEERTMRTNSTTDVQYGAARRRGYVLENKLPVQS